MRQLSAVYFNSKLASHLWKDDASALDLEEMSRRFAQWTYLPMLPNREEALRGCIREGIGQNLWAVVLGDDATSTYHKLVEAPTELDEVTALFDGSASLVKGDLLKLSREQLGVGTDEGEQGAADEEKPEKPGADGEVDKGPIPAPSKRLKNVRLRIEDLQVGKTSNLQPYLFKVLQELDAGVVLTITVEVDSDAGIPEDVFDSRIVEAFDQLGISINWDTGSA